MNDNKNRFVTLLILIIFFLSGLSALLYQVAWQRLLTVYYGVGFYSVTLIVSIYMFGLGLGGYFGGLLAERSKNKVKIYLLIEILIGCFGIVSPALLDLIGKSTAGMNYFLTTLILFSFLSIPTFLMGTTLPMLVKIYNMLEKNFFNSVSILYFVNTLGAAFGAIIATYIIVSFFGLDSAVHTAVFINVLIGLTVYLFISKFYKSHTVDQSETQIAASKLSTPRIIYLIVFVTGFVAIGYELIWFRVISVLTKDSAYSFSSVLFIFLLGLALGSFFVNRITRKYDFEKKKRTYFILQFSLGVFTLLSFFLFYKLNTFPNYFSVLADDSFNRMIHPDFKRPHGFRELILNYDILFWPFLFLFIPTLIMGASFPLVTYLGMKDENSEGRTVGTIYFFNVSGNVLGGIATGFLLLPVFKTTGTLTAFTFINAIFLIGAIDKNNRRSVVVKSSILAAVILFSLFFFPDNSKFYEAIHSPYPDRFHKEKYNVCIEEGRESVVVTYYDDTAVYRNYINGSNHGFRPGLPYFYETFETVKYCRNPENVLVIGFGAGSIVEAVLKCPATKTVTLVEINKTLLDNFEKIDEIKAILHNPKLTVLIEDGRRFLNSKPTKYDVIFLDPLRTQTAYSNNIHSKNFFELVKSRLNPGGVMMVGGEQDMVKVKTVTSAYAHMRSYKYFTLGKEQPFIEDSLVKAGFWSAFNLREQQFIAKEDAYKGDETSIRDEFFNFPYSSDWNPVNEYFLGREYKINKSLQYEK